MMQKSVDRLFILILFTVLYCNFLFIDFDFIFTSKIAVYINGSVDSFLISKQNFKENGFVELYGFIKSVKYVYLALDNIIIVLRMKIYIIK